MDHKSPSRFSIGVPVSANLDFALSFLAARVLELSCPVPCRQPSTPRARASSGGRATALPLAGKAAGSHAVPLQGQCVSTLRDFAAPLAFLPTTDLRLLAPS